MFYDRSHSTVSASRSIVIPAERMLTGINGLRGMAALAVVLYHIVHLVKITTPEFFAFIGSDFGKGVHLFFVVSAFSLMYSTEITMQYKSWMSEYFIRRFFRIAPLYYCIMTGMIIWPAINSHALNYNFQTILLNITFTFGLAPWSGIVWAGWTVGVEMLFYVVFPVLLITIRSTFVMFVMLIVSLAITYAARSILHIHYQSHISDYGYNWAYFSFPANLFYFAIGMFVFRIYVLINKTSFIIAWLIPVFSLVLLGALMFTKNDSLLFQWKDEAILWGIGFGALCLWQSKNASKWCANRLFEYFGERSYSIYLLHPIVIILLKKQLNDVYSALTPYFDTYAYFACVLVVMMPLLLLSEMAYRIIEVPGIRFGKKINSRMRECAANAAPQILNSSANTAKHLA